MAEEDTAGAALPNGTSNNDLGNGIAEDDERAEADQRKTYAEAVAAKEEGGERPTTTRQQPKKSARKSERPAPMKAEHPGRHTTKSISPLFAPTLPHVKITQPSFRF